MQDCLTRLEHSAGIEINILAIHSSIDIEHFAFFFYDALGITIALSISLFEVSLTPNVLLFLTVLVRLRTLKCELKWHIKNSEKVIKCFAVELIIKLVVK